MSSPRLRLLANAANMASAAAVTVTVMRTGAANRAELSPAMTLTANDAIAIAQSISVTPAPG